MSRFIIAMTRVSGDVAELQCWAAENDVEDRMLVSSELHGVTTVLFLTDEDETVTAAFLEYLGRPGADWAFEAGALQFHQVS